jgi:hypothetical protein
MGWSLCWAVQGRLLQILGQINRSYLGLTSKEWHGFMAYIQASIYVALILFLHTRRYRPNGYGNPNIGY